MRIETGRALAAGLFTVALVAKLGVIVDGRMGASKARAERIKLVVTAHEAATKEWL